MERSRPLPIVSCALLALLIGACGPVSSVTVGRGDRPSVHSERERRAGPPPHAPAHGHRRKHGEGERHDAGDAELVFDSALGVYVVVGLPDHFYWNGYYIRIDGDRWYASTRLDGDWKPTSVDSLPPGLRKHEPRRNAKGRRRGPPGPAKERW